MNETLRIVVSLIALYLIYIVVTAVYEAFFTSLAKYPGPALNALSRIPRMIHLLRGTEIPHLASLHAAYGPVVRVGPRELSYTEGAQAWKDIYGFTKNGVAGNKDRHFYSRPLNGVESIFIANNAAHGRMRKTLSHSFSDRALKQQEPLLKRWTALLRQKLRQQAQTAEPADMVKFYNCTTFDIMGDLTFSEDLGMLKDGELSPWVKLIFASIKQLGFLRALKSIALSRYIVEEWISKRPAMRKKVAAHFANTQVRVARRLAREPEHPDLWTKVLEKGKIEGEGLSRDEHDSNAEFFMLAGTETTATALSGVTFFLLHSPGHLAQLKEEIRGAFRTSDDFTLESLARLKFLNAVLLEGLRLYPPVPVGMPRRTPAAGATICGEFVPGDVSVSVHQYATFRSPAHFTRPNEFLPERWLGDPAFKDDNQGAFEPFAVGPRNCLGKNLAWHEMRMILATVLMDFDLALAEASGDDWLNQKSWLLWEKKPFWCKVTAAAA